LLGEALMEVVVVLVALEALADSDRAGRPSTAR
jgi:hypothetical protein